MSKSRKLTFILALLAMFFIVPPASAHRPEEGADAGPTMIPDPNTSYAYYRQIDSPTDVHTYTFTGQADQFFHAGINIPQIKGLEDFEVTMALLGPGLPALGGEAGDPDDPLHAASESEHQPHDTHTLSLPAGFDTPIYNGIILKSQPGEDFFEPFTQTNYWGKQQIDLNLPDSGTYTLVVWSPEGETGKYVLDTGTEEVFSPADLLRFPKWWLDTRLFFEQGTALAVIGSVLFFGIFGIAFYWVRKR